MYHVLFKIIHESWSEPLSWNSDRANYGPHAKHFILSAFLLALLVYIVIHLSCVHRIANFLPTAKHWW